MEGFESTSIAPRQIPVRGMQTVWKESTGKGSPSHQGTVSLSGASIRHQ